MAGQAAQEEGVRERGKWPLGFWLAILGIALELFGLYGLRMRTVASASAVADSPAGEDFRTQEPMVPSSTSESPFPTQL